MRRALRVVLALALLACGAESEPDARPAGGAAAPLPDAKDLIESASAAVRQAAAEEATRCLGLLEAESHADAVAVCRRAVGMDPYNDQVVAALDTAEKETRARAIARCLELVRRSEFADGVEACGSAHGMAPEHEEVRAALERAQLEAALLAEEAEKAEAAEAAPAEAQ